MKRGIVIALAASLAAVALLVARGRFVAHEPASVASEALVPPERSDALATSRTTDASAPPIESAAADSGASSPARSERTTEHGTKAGTDPTSPVPVLAGRVVLHRDSPADERVSVLVETTPFRTRRDPVLVDADGRFRIELARGARRAELHVVARYHFLGERVELSVARLPAEVLVEPELGGIVRGTVRAEGGEPLSRGGVATCIGGMSSARFAEFGGDGEFELQSVPASGSVALLVEAEGHSAAREVIEVRAGELVEARILLPPPVSLAGRVVDEGGRALEGVQVAALHSHTRERVQFAISRRACEAVTDALGSFRIEGLPSGNIELVAKHDEHLQATVSVGTLDPGENRQGCVIELVRERILAGRVRWPDGSPANGARVIASVRGGRQSQVVADEHGAFAVPDLRAGLYTVQAEAERATELDASASTWRAVCEDVAPGEWEPELVLRPGPVLRGSVVNDLGEPIPRFRVRAEARARGRGDPLTPSVQQQFDDARGEFALGGMWRGRFDLLVRAEGHTQAALDDVELPQLGAPPRVVLPRLATLAGSVRGPDGERVPDARVRVQPLLADGSSSTFPRTMRVDDSGEFARLPIVPGALLLVASADGYARSEELAIEVAPAQARGGLRLVLRRAATLRVELAQKTDATSRSGVQLFGPAPSEEPRTLYLDAEGEGEFRDLPPGRYRVTLGALAFRVVSGDANEVGPPPRDEKELELREGEHALVVLGDSAPR